MFQQIADEELEHYERLKELHGKWENKEKWPETVPLKVKDTIVRDVLQDIVKKTEKMPEKEPLLDARKIVMNFGGLKALNGVDVQVGENEILGLILTNLFAKTFKKMNSYN